MLQHKQLGESSRGFLSLHFFPGNNLMALLWMEYLTKANKFHSRMNSKVHLSIPRGLNVYLQLIFERRSSPRLTRRKRGEKRGEKRNEKCVRRRGPAQGLRSPKPKALNFFRQGGIWCSFNTPVDATFASSFSAIGPSLTSYPAYPVTSTAFSTLTSLTS